MSGPQDTIAALLDRRVIVVGAGVSGLTCALRCATAGARVEILAREEPSETTSTVAAAIWSPFHAFPADRVDAWALASYRTFQRQAAAGTPGVTMRTGVDLRPTPAAPSWTQLPGAPPVRTAGSIHGLHGIRFEAPIIETPIYVPHLRDALTSHGVSIQPIALASLDDLVDRADLVIDCAGLGARELARDASLHPVRGQIVRIDREGIETFTLFEQTDGTFGYVIPRSTDCILGGTTEVGVDDRTPSPEQATAIVERCARFVPEVASAQVLDVLVGLRPGRPTVRLETGRLSDGTPVVHDYGHGGAGITLSHGCAAEVLERAIEVLAAAPLH